MIAWRGSHDPVRIWSWHLLNGSKPDGPRDRVEVGLLGNLGTSRERDEGGRGEKYR